jgi:hypothetical protein
MRSHLRQSLFKGGLHLFGRCPRGNLRSHIIQMMFQILDSASMLTFEGAGDDLSKVTLGRHLSGARLGLQRGGILLREVNGHIHKPVPSSVFSVTHGAEAMGGFAVPELKL